MFPYLDKLYGGYKLWAYLGDYNELPSPFPSVTSIMRLEKAIRKLHDPELNVMDNICTKINVYHHSITELVFTLDTIANSMAIGEQYPKLRPLSQSEVTIVEWITVESVCDTDNIKLLYNALRRFKLVIAERETHEVPPYLDRMLFNAAHDMLQIANFIRI